MRPLVPLFALVLLPLVGCENDNSLAYVPNLYGHGDGAITGRVCDPESLLWLQGATVYTHIIDTAGELRDTRKTLTDENGEWTLDDLADGIYTVYVQYGSTTVDMFDATVSNGREVEVPNATCAGSAETDVAVVTGDFDNFEKVLKKVGIGGAYDVDGQRGEELLQFLGNVEEMKTYDAIFFAGGHLESGIFYGDAGDEAVKAVKANLKEYVEKGGVIYASDWSYDVLEETWPSQIEFIDETAPDASQIGEPELLKCEITMSGLEEAVGRETVKMNLDLDAWPVVDSVGDDAKVFLRADAPWRKGMDTGTEKDSPMLVEFGVGKGTVIFTPWRMSANLDDGQIDVVRWLIERHLGE
jgi:hypothetical protein